MHLSYTVFSSFVPVSIQSSAYKSEKVFLFVRFLVNWSLKVCLILQTMEYMYKFSVKDNPFYFK